MLFPVDHPIRVLQLLIDRYNRLGYSVFFEFSKYIYSPQSVIDERETFILPHTNINDYYISNIINGLKKNQELALHSKVLLNDQLLHIPMIDFSISSSSIDIYELIEMVKSVLTHYFRFLLDDAFIFHSGRSFHWYATVLLSYDDWVKFMGNILLINFPGKIELVDSRWVGHRLVSGFGSLRWTSNSMFYKKVPTRIII